MESLSRSIFLFCRTIFQKTGSHFSDCALVFPGGGDWEDSNSKQKTLSIHIDNDAPLNTAFENGATKVWQIGERGRYNHGLQFVHR